MLLLLPPGVERRTGNTKTVTDTGNAVGSAGARRDRGSHYRDLRRAKGPTCPTRARNTSFSIVSSPIRFIAAASSSLAASPSRSRNDPSIPDSARSRQRSSRYEGTPSSRDRFSADSPRSRRSTTSRLRHWDRSRARLAVGGGFPFLLFRLQVGFTVPPWLTFPGAPYNPGRPDFPGPV